MDRTVRPSTTLGLSLSDCLACFILKGTFTANINFTTKFVSDDAERDTIYALAPAPATAATAAATAAAAAAAAPAPAGSDVGRLRSLRGR